MDKKTRLLSIGDILYPIILASLLFVKSNNFYSYLHLDKFPIAFAFATAGILLIVYSIIAVFSPKAARITATVMYFFISVIMGVAGVYYSYVSKLPTFAQLGMVSQLDDISESIEGLIKTKDVMMLIDLPIWIIYFANRTLLR